VERIIAFIGKCDIPKHHTQPACEKTDSFAEDPNIAVSVLFTRPSVASRCIQAPAII
jgi:hypothetical protein